MISIVKGTTLACAVASLLTLVACLGGCSMPVSATYTPIAATESLTDGVSRPRVYVAKFEDARTDKERLGAMKNSFGGDAKKLTTTDDLPLLLAEATTDALRKGGLDAALHGDRTADSSIPADELKGVDFVVGGRIKQATVETNPGWGTIRITSKVVIDVYVKCGANGEWVGPIEGTSEMRDFNSNYLQASSLSSALDKAIGNCMRNTVRHLKASGVFERQVATAKPSH